MKITILDDSFDTLRGLPCFSKLKGLDVTVWTEHIQDTEQLAARLALSEVLVLFRERTQITAALLDRLPHLRLISQRSVYPHIDLEACTRNGVLLCSNLHTDTPSYAAAELTWALILSSMRQIPEQVASLRSGSWQMAVGRSLRGRRLGLYGYGRIAAVVAEYAQAFGMQVLWWASAQGRARAQADGRIVAASREDFFSTCDIVSLHLRLKPQTRHIITPADFGNMRRDALFVNTSRAGLIAPGALASALASDSPGSFALDVFDHEPISKGDDPLVHHPKVLATPHIGYVTQEELETQFSDIFDQILAFRDSAPIHMINPEVWAGMCGLKG